jgi:hypothetical protein
MFPLSAIGVFAPQLRGKRSLKMVSRKKKAKLIDRRIRVGLILPIRCLANSDSCLRRFDFA